MPSFMEVQFPVSRLSKESYKERKANHGQTLTGLGKWWGRKPLVLVRATILGLLMPASDDAKKDREIFLKIMTMDDDGLRLRRQKSMSQDELFAVLDEADRRSFFTAPATGKPRWKPGLSKGDKDAVQDKAFAGLNYDQKLAYCLRPENIDGPSAAAWKEINAHLGTKAKNLAELVRELGEKRFGHVPRVGDAFCGGGSIPFEAARIGCDAYASDLNPVAALLSWAALNLVGGGAEVAAQVQAAQKKVFDAVDEQVIEWGIEHDEEGRRADAYLYCNEVKCPECGWMVPLAPSWVIGEKSMAIALLVPDEKRKRFEIEIKSGVSETELKKAKASGTAVDGVRCPSPVCDGEKTTPMSMMRGDRGGKGEKKYGLRLWENEDLVPRPDDVFQERLYCIRWVAEDGGRAYAAPTNKDLAREEKVLTLLRERFAKWQANGYVPSAKIEPGEKTDEPIRTRGWAYWHHLFNPRQLLIQALFMRESLTQTDMKDRAVGLLAASRLADWNCRLSRWDSSAANEKGAQTFSDQALNPLYNYSVRPIAKLKTTFFVEIPPAPVAGRSSVEVSDARMVTRINDFWITDPPYADAVAYHELTELFLAWQSPFIVSMFPSWYTDTRRALAVVGSDEAFRRSMVDTYRNLATHMPEDGQQVVMFTHQDASVWADLALIMWAAGLHVTAAWCIATETENPFRVGNYVQGTVLLVLRKRSGNETAFVDDLYAQVEDEVRRQLESMLALDDQDEPNFGDPDLQLAAYAAALRVLTRYQRIEDFDIAEELKKVRVAGETSPVVKIIEQAVHVATEFLVPGGLDKAVWKRLGPEERLYLKGLEVEAAGEQRAGVYQELARGFGVDDYRGLLASSSANATRLRTATEFEARDLGAGRFGSSVVRAALFASAEVAKSGETAGARQWLKTELTDYWDRRTHLVAVLEQLAALAHTLPHWKKDAEAAAVLAGAVRNENV